MKIKRWQLAVGLIAALSSCSKPALFNSKWETNPRGVEVESAGVDAKSEIRYSVYNDNHNLYVSIDSDKRGIMRSVIKKGVFLHIDTLGKTKGEMYLRYPVIDQQQINAARDARKKAREKALNSNKPFQRGQRANIPQKIAWAADGKTEQLMPSDSNQLDIEGNIRRDSLGMTINFTIPLHLISSKSQANFPPLILGIDIPGTVPQSQQGGEGGPGHGMDGHHGPPMGGGRGMGEGMEGGERPHFQGGYTEPVKFWINVKLAATPG